MSRFQRKPLPESRNPRASIFGAFDFSVTPDGRWWFLECNPAGQWGWIAEETGLPIAGAIADELVRAV
ncbi:MAG: hypothetical protein ACRDRU_10105 [Pseudonocardiaceae bacterium]